MKLSVLTKPSIAISATLFTSLLSADELDTRVKLLENKMNQIRTETASGSYTAAFASGVPQNEGYGFFFTADLIVWKLYEGSAYQNVANTTYTPTNERFDNLGSQTIDAEEKNLDFPWRCGFKAGAGYVMAHDSWDFYLNYTQYETSVTHSTMQTPIPQNLKTGGGNVRNSAVLSTSITNNPLNFQSLLTSNNSVSTERKIHLYNVDLEVGKSYFLTKYFSVRPNFGVKTAWLHQSLSSTNNYSPGGTLFKTLVNSTGFTVSAISAKNNFWGIGPRIGADLNWFFARYFNLFSNFSGSILWGSFKVQQNETLNGSIVSPTPPLKAGSISFPSQPFTNEIKASPHRFAPVAELEVGIEFNIPFADNAYNFSCKVAYENQYWWRQNFLTDLSFMDLYTTTYLNEFGVYDMPITSLAPLVNLSVLEEPRLSTPDDLSFQGLTVEFRFDF